MNTAIQETCVLIEHYKVLQREVAIEGPEQIATITRVMKHNIPLTIEKFQRLIELEKMVPQLIEKIRILEDELHDRKSNVGA